MPAAMIFWGVDFAAEQRPSVDREVITRPAVRTGFARLAFRTAMLLGPGFLAHRDGSHEALPGLRDWHDAPLPAH